MVFNIFCVELLKKVATSQALGKNKATKEKPLDARSRWYQLLTYLLIRQMKGKQPERK